MFSALVQNSVFYILDKNTKPSIKIGKVVKVDTNPQCFGLSNQELDIVVDVNGDTYEFKKIPANLSIVSPSKGIIISDNPDDMSKEFETMVTISQQTLDSIDYHKSVVESKDSILSILNPRFAKEKEQENKFNSLETRVGSMEQGIDDIKSMLSKILNNK
nr:MAG TPA: hypothetical protein [Crassvirales sp.]DAR29015.1 MAG TPA: hypothetical protein [Crassvirales sp.]